MNDRKYNVSLWILLGLAVWLIGFAAIASYVILGG